MDKFISKSRIGKDTIGVPLESRLKKLSQLLGELPRDALELFELRQKFPSNRNGGRHYILYCCIPAGAE